MFSWAVQLIEVFLSHIYFHYAWIRYNAKPKPSSTTLEPNFIDFRLTKLFGPTIEIK